MKLFSSRVVWGILLIVGGTLFLLENLGVLRVGNLFWAIVLGFAGLVFLSVFISQRSNWWALIPGIVLLTLGLLVAMGVLAPGIATIWGGAFFLGGISLAFWLIYLVDRSNWWAVIPGGVLLTLAVVAGLSEFATGLEVGGIFFIGLGLTFALLAILPNPGADLRWAYIPAAILIVFGLLISAAAADLINYLWPAILILLGLFLIYRTLIYRRS